MLTTAFSLGGSYKLELYSRFYKDVYNSIYLERYECLKKLKCEIEKEIEFIGKNIEKLHQALLVSSNILKKNKVSSQSASISKTAKTIARIEKFNISYNSTLNTGFGGFVGGATAIGAWGLVSIVGSASTGTAISTLSGAAATNATLAWFGGGSLATGGAGMVGGMWVLGGIAAVPMVYFSTKKSYGQIDEVKNSINKLIEESSKLDVLVIDAKEQLGKIKVESQKLSDFSQEICKEIECKISGFKKIRTFYSVFFNRYNDAQIEVLSSIEKHANEIILYLESINLKL